MVTRGLYAALLVPLFGQADFPARIDFARDVQPLFKRIASPADGPMQQMGNLRLDRRRDAMRGGSIAGNRTPPAQAVDCIDKLTGTRYGPQMPPTGPLHADNIEIIKRWLEQGAPWPDELAGDAPQPPHDPVAARMMEALRDRGYDCRSKDAYRRIEVCQRQRPRRFDALNVRSSVFRCRYGEGSASSGRKPKSSQ